MFRGTVNSLVNGYPGASQHGGTLVDIMTEWDSAWRNGAIGRSQVPAEDLWYMVVVGKKPGVVHGLYVFLIYFLEHQDAHDNVKERCSPSCW